MHLLLEGWEDGEAVSVRLDAPDRAQVQSAEKISLQGLPNGAIPVTIQQRVIFFQRVDGSRA